MMHTAVIVVGLMLFEIISSIDNAVINAHVLRTMPEKFRRIFLVWGILLAVFVVRGVLPFLIVWIANPALSLAEVVRIAFMSGEGIGEYLGASKPLLLIGGGVYLVMVFLGWLFLEDKRYAIFVEHFIHRQGVWFYAVSSVFFTAVVWAAVHVNPLLAFAAAVGTTAFFITDGFKKNAEEQERRLLDPRMSAWSKILYLEVLDASFSIDGVIGAFAFTMSVPLIILGNGLGALVVREFTVKGIDLIAKLAYLKNGAMYSIGILGSLMVAESFGRHYPFWLAPAATTTLLLFFLWLSKRDLARGGGIPIEGTEHAH